MQIKQGNSLQALRGVQAFLDAHAAILGPVATSGARKKLDAQIDALRLYALTQNGSNLTSRGATQKQYALREALLQDHMAHIARIAEADLPHTPELAPLRVPRNNVTTEVLHSAAFGMAEAAEPYKAVFIASGLPDDFIDQLKSAADAMVGSLDTRRQSRGLRRGATKGLVELVRDARKTVRVLNAFVRTVIKDDAALLADWDEVRREHKKPGVPRSVGTPVTPTPSAPTPAPLTPTPAASPPPLAPDAVLNVDAGG